MFSLEYQILFLMLIYYYRITLLLRLCIKAKIWVNYLFATSPSTKTTTTYQFSFSKFNLYFTIFDFIIVAINKIEVPVQLFRWRDYDEVWCFADLNHKIQRHAVKDVLRWNFCLPALLQSNGY